MWGRCGPECPQLYLFSSHDTLCPPEDVGSCVVQRARYCADAEAEQEVRGKIEKGLREIAGRRETATTAADQDRSYASHRQPGLAFELYADSPHVTHFKQHPKSYRAAVDGFFRDLSEAWDGDDQHAAARAASLSSSAPLGDHPDSRL